ncbi:acyltransferase [Roseomonas sp. SSH11]|uniref:Acyltransferase n=1 Tax=Pararoseomonas baculiformis TaxID=2820812 RepID=A0ABS4AIG8_9PROT|nr:acyltransferase [Pararoseomonas baculiformis]MBP0446674.1 acyltransferase [Pararoseomonas baculiformis]
MPESSEISSLGRSPGRIAFAHGLRGLAALAVLLSHYTEHFWNHRAAAATFLGAPEWEGPAPAVVAVHAWLPEDFAGHFGVALFFLISGFVVPFSLFGRGRAGFALGRFLRIWPTYVAGLSVTMLAVLASSRYFGRPVPFGWAEWLAQILFIRDLLGMFSIDGIVWTLEIEVRFYLLCLLIAPVLWKGQVRPLLATGLVLTGVFAILGAMPLPAGWGGGLGELALSAQMITFMLVGAVFGAWHRGTAGWTACLGAGAALLGLFALQWAGGVMAGQLLPGLASYGAALALFAALFARRHAIRRVPRPWDWLARISYPLYVVHGVAGYAVIRLMLEAGAPPLAAILLAALLAFGCAILLHRLVEVPTQRAGHRVSRDGP